MDFSGKIVFVTAAANGIGLGICQALARSGVNLVLADQRAQLDIAREELSSFNIRTRAIELDASDAEAFACRPGRRTHLRCEPRTPGWSSISIARRGAMTWMIMAQLPQPLAPHPSSAAARARKCRPNAAPRPGQDRRRKTG